MQNESGRSFYSEQRKHQKYGQNGTFFSSSDLLYVCYERNEHIDKNPIKSCQASSDTSIEYQQGVDGT